MAQSVIGGPYTAPDETTVYANSGMVDFDVTAAAFYDMLQFTDQRDIRWSMTFNCDWDILEATNDAVGVVVNVGGVPIIRLVFEAMDAGRGPGGPWLFDFFVPANMAVDIDVLNPDAGASLLQANVTMVGTVITPAVKGDAAVGGDRALGGSSTYVPETAPAPTKSYPDADKFPDLPTVPITEEWGD